MASKTSLEGNVGSGTQKRKRNSTAVEPEAFVGQIKICPFCNEASECDFKYCNNNKTNQPRYKCRKCTKLFSPNRMRPKVFVNGYNKKQQHSGEEEETLLDEMLLAQCNQQLEGQNVGATREILAINLPTYDPPLMEARSVEVVASNDICKRNVQQLEGQNIGVAGELLATNIPTYDPSLVEATTVEVVASNDICESCVQYAPHVVPEQENIYYLMDEQRKFASLFTSYGLRNERNDASIYGPGEPTVLPSFDWCLEPLTSMDWIDSEVPDIYFGAEQIDEEFSM